MTPRADNPQRLRALLTQAARHDAEYGASLSNHLPMALTALARLGADDERLAEFAQRYAQRLHDAPPRVPWPAGEPWRASLGEPSAWPRYRSLFADWIAHEGAADMLAQVLPFLLQGVGAAAFHGAIRAAYALAANHADELADALAYWACRWFDCGSATPQGGDADPAQPLALVSTLRLPEQALIAQAMAQAAADARVQRAVARLHVDARTTLPRLAALAAERYSAQGGFTTLHLVTSAHAMAVLLPRLDDEAATRIAALGAYAAAFVAAWATLGPPPAPMHAGTAAQVPAWDEIVARAIDSDDEHRIKLVDSCRELEAAQGGAVWHLAAARAVV